MGPEKKILVSGSCGLIGSEVTRRFSELGHSVTGIDNNLRAAFLGPEGETSWMLKRLNSECPRYKHSVIDMRDRNGILRLVENLRPALISAKHIAFG